MDIIKETKQLAEILREKQLGYIYVKNGEVEIEIAAPETQMVYTGQAASYISDVPVAAPQAAPATVVADTPGNYVKSPIIGTFYSAPAPDKPAFVKVGDKVETGQVVCIIESMKLMNEITSEFAGTVAEILVKDAEAVEFDKKLIRIE